MSNVAASKKMIAKLSPSRAKDFMQCPRLFYYTSVLGIRTPGTEATFRGTVAHYVFERIFDHPRGERGVEVALEYVRPAFALIAEPLPDRSTVEPGSHEERMRELEKRYRGLHEEGSDSEARLLREAAELRAVVPVECEDEFLATVEHAVRGWYEMENPEKFDPAERELYLMVKVAGVTLHGFIDRLDRAAAADGTVKVYISDYKTGKLPRPQYQDEAFFQLEVYALLLSEKFGEKAHQLRLIYVKEGSPSAVLTRNVTDEMLTRTRRKVQAVWKGIQDAARRDQWAPKKQVLCGWCYFQDVCPAHHPELDGMLPEEVEVRLSSR